MTGRYSDLEELRPTGEASHVPDDKLSECGDWEVLLAEGCAVGIGRFELAAATPDTIGMLPRSHRPISASRARCVLPKLLEMPLDEGVKRLSPKL